MAETIQIGLKECVVLRFRSLQVSMEEVRYFYGQRAGDKARAYLDRYHPDWYELFKITKITEKIGSSNDNR
jgi:hypothetical protein